MSLQSYKPYARIITIISAVIIAIASLDATQVINLFPAYESQINTVLMIAGILAPAIAQEKRVVRAEDLIKEDYDTTSEDSDISINANDGVNKEEEVDDGTA